MLSVVKEIIVFFIKDSARIQGVSVGSRDNQNKIKGTLWGS